MYYTQIDSPIGPFLLVGDGESLSMTSFSTGHQQRRPEPDWREDPAALRFAVEQFEEYFAGDRAEFELALTLSGTEFQKDVWRTLQKIPYGEAWSYGRVAREIGRPGASRAVGAANAANRLPIVVPCHRVVGSDGTLTGFGGGLDTKQWLLTLEGAPLSRQKSLF